MSPTEIQFAAKVTLAALCWYFGWRAGRNCEKFGAVVGVIAYGLCCFGLGAMLAFSHPK